MKRTNYGALIKYEPNLPHDPNYIYTWSFSDGTTYATREVYKNNVFLTGTLTIYHAGVDQCCEVTKKFGRSIIYDDTILLP